MAEELKWGDFCRARCTAPARYIGSGKCVYISASGNDRVITDVDLTASGDDLKNLYNLPLCDDAELRELTARMLRSKP